MENPALTDTAAGSSITDEGTPAKESAAATSSAPLPYRFAFVMDQQVGLKTQALNFAEAVSSLTDDDDVSVEPLFVPVEYQKESGWLSRLFLQAGGIRGTLREIRDGLRGNQGRLDGVLWATWAAKSVPDLVRTAPAFLRMDMTPTQREAMGAQYGYAKLRARLGGGFKRRATQKLYREAAHHFPWSEYVARSLRRDWGVPAEKITVVSPGVDTAAFKPCPAAKPNDGVVRFLFVGGDFTRKGGDLLLQWARNAGRTRRAHDMPFELHIVTREALPGDSIPAGVFVYRNIANNSPELRALYQKCDVFVLPTRADCYSLVALEAMASGLPVIISDIGGISDIVDNGVTGYLIQPGDEGDLISALEKLLADSRLRTMMGAAGRVRACVWFDSRRAAETILGAMMDAADERRSPRRRQIHIADLDTDTTASAFCAGLPAPAFFQEAFADRTAL